MVWFVGGEVSIFHGHGQQLRRGFTARLCTNKMAKRARVSAGRESNTVQGLGKEMGQPNGVAAVAFYLGHGEVDAAASTPSWRCTEGSGVGVVRCGVCGEAWG